LPETPSGPVVIKRVYRGYNELLNRGNYSRVPYLNAGGLMCTRMNKAEGRRKGFIT